MTNVAGRLVDVTDAPSLVVSVWVRARRVRVHGGDVVTGEGARVPITDGRVSFTCLPGPAVLTLERAGVPAEVIPLVVPDEVQVSLGVCVDASRLAKEYTADALEELAGRAAGAVEHSEAAAGEAKTHAGVASSAAEFAARDAKDAAASAKAAVSSASEATQSAGKAASSAAGADNSAGLARSYSSEARDSASQAKASADRADKVASSTSWSGDRLTVNGRTSPPLTGPRGPMGRVEDHTHPISEVNGLDVQLDWYKNQLNFYVEMLKGMASQEDVSALQADLVSVRAELEAVRARPALWSGSGKPPASIPGARTGDWWLDESSKDLYRITGV